MEVDYRATINHMKLKTHSERQLKRKDPGIKTLARKYNALCAEMMRMISSGEAPPNAVSPCLLGQEGLYSLDVDDDIWGDAGLMDVDGEPPRWLADEDIRSGIKAMLNVDRCGEEMDRLVKECAALCQWAHTEWLSVTSAIADMKDIPTACYQLQLKQEYLADLCLLWQDATRLIPGEHNEKGRWGLTAVDLAKAHNARYTLNLGRQIEDFFDGESSSELEDITTDDEGWGSD
jgi:hypothetical protein